MVRKVALRSRQRLDKYRIERRIAEGPFASVYRAYDTIEGIRVALKIPHLHLADDVFLEDFRKEVRLTARLEHANILPVKNASFVRDRFVIVLPLGQETLADRLQKRLSFRTAMDYAQQMLEAVAHAHAHRIIHCDIKPENVILFSDGVLRLADFGIAKVARRTINASGSGTIGYVAPEQAMGRPSYSSDVFSLGLILYRMFSGRLPNWPYDWPAPGYERLRGRVHPLLIEFLKRAIDPKPARRFLDAEQMLSVFERIKPRVLAYESAGRRRRRPAASATTKDWQEVRRLQFRRMVGRHLEARHACRRCSGPVSETMRLCPWCGTSRKIHRDETKFPSRCTRCKRGMKLDWKYCPWCYGRSRRQVSDRSYSDVRYNARCANTACRGPLMPFMRYCPWCNQSVKRRWKTPGLDHRCPSCGWGVAGSYWSHCPWCTRSLPKR